MSVDNRIFRPREFQLPRMNSKVRFGSSLKRLLAGLPLNQGLMSWFTEHVKLDDRYLRRWLRGDNLPSEGSWRRLSEVLKPYCSQDPRLHAELTRLESILVGTRQSVPAHSCKPTSHAIVTLPEPPQHNWSQRVVGFAPAMLDINVVSRATSKAYLKALNRLGVRPGDWSPVNSFEDLIEIVNQVSGEDLKTVLKSSHGWEVGSTIAGALLSFTPEYRGERILRLAYPEVRFDRDIDSSLLLSKLAESGVAATLLPCGGTIDVCLSTYHKAIPERTMMVHRGLRSPARVIDVSVEQNAVCFISLFEIARRFFAVDPTELARRGSVLALSLGDKKILTPGIRRTVLSWMRSGILAYLFGDLEDYQKCFQGESSGDEENVIDMAKHYSTQYPTTFFITAGGGGIYSTRAGRLHHQTVRRATGLINTNGGGDAAAGGFLSADLATGNIEEALSFAMSRAESVLQLRR